MPLPAALVAALPYIVQGVGMGLGYVGQRQSEKKQQQMLAQQQQNNVTNYQMQRKDALSDQQSQNAYNSPQQQMQRLREAGLNPHLIYGKGAENTAAAIRASSSQNPTAPPIQTSPLTASVQGGQAALEMFTALRYQRAQTDNLYSQRALTDASTAATLQRTARDKFDYGQADRAKDIAFEQLLKNYENSIKSGDKLTEETKLIGQQSSRLEQLTPLEVQKTTQEISNLKTTQELTKTQTDKVIADTQSVLDGNKRANELQESTVQLLLLQVNEQRQKMGLDPVTMPELKAKLDLMSSDNALKQFELEYQEQFRKLGTVAKAAYMAAMLYKALKD